MKTKYIFLSVFLFWGSLHIWSQSKDQNYVATKVMTDASGSSSRDVIQYYDGLGRPMEQVQKASSPSKNDMVSYQEYDIYGRESKSWLPVSYPNGQNGNYVSFSNFESRTKDSLGNKDNYPYSEAVYEPSPMNRIEKAYGPGSAWRSDGGHSVNTGYLTNNPFNPQLNCTYFYLSGDNFGKNGNYASGSLYVTKISDEDDKISYEFKDKLGRVVLQRQISDNENHDTYFIYDEWGNLNFVLPPLAADIYSSSGNKVFSVYSNVAGEGKAVQDYGYIYLYDHRNRCKAKKLPGIGFQNMIYDRSDRLVLSQDEMQKGKRYTFYKYDVHGRLLMSGEYPYTGSFDNLRYSFENSLVIEAPENNNLFTYSRNSAPLHQYGQITSVNFYDGHSFIYQFGRCHELEYVSKSGYDPVHSDSHGLLTGTLVKLLDGSHTEIVTAYYYDNKGRVVQKRTQSHLKGYDAEYYHYNFDGSVNKKCLEHNLPGQDPVTEVYSYEYDHAGRLKETRHQVNNQREVVLASYAYNELGQMNEKRLGGGRNIMSYSYNVRGWLESQLSNQFSQRLQYMTNPRADGQKYYGGNISTTLWKSSDMPGTWRGYVFHYDDLGRMQHASYGEQEDMNSFRDRYNDNYRYDKHGNIRNIYRFGRTRSGLQLAYNMMDNLDVFEYSGNKVLRIQDYSGNFSASDLMEFKDVYHDHTEYLYDSNGNMMADGNKKLCNIEYNFLNLPERIQHQYGHVVEYVYDASGVKRETRHKTSRSDLALGFWGRQDLSAAQISETLTTDYISNKVYEQYKDGSRSLKFLLTDEGYLRKNGSTFTYYYHVRDHLGNTRVVMDENSNIAQVNNYYPFGATFAEPVTRSDQGVQPYKYNGKELDGMYGMNLYDYGARFYDPALSRFMTMDPLAEKRPWESPYSYAGNNPILNVDPTGEDYWSTNDPGLIRQFMNSVGSGSTQHDFSGWRHATDAQFTGNLTYNDETGKYYTSYGTIENGVPTIVGVSFDANIIPVSFSGEGYKGAFVYEYGNETWSPLYSFMYGITPFAGFLGPIDPSRYGPWAVNASGRITGLAPTIGYAPMAGKGKGGIGKGERGYTKSASGTNNPFKKMKPDPNNPKKVLMKDANGKTIEKPKPEGFDDYWNKKYK